MIQSKDILHGIATMLSVILYPMLMPTYGMICFSTTMKAIAGGMLPWQIAALCVGMTFLLTVLIPISAIKIMIRRGKVSDLQIADARERTVPYLYTLCSFGFWCYFLIGVLHVPGYVGITAIGGTVALFIVMLINFRWKISAHLTGMGGLIGGVMSYYLTGGGENLVFPLVLMVVALMLMYARLYLNAHTPLQVVAGLLLGLCCTFIPNMILAYVV